MTIELNIEWPAELIPLPYVDYSGGNRDATLFPSSDSAASLRRSRFSRTYYNLDISWRLRVIEYEAFLEFFKTTTNNGAALFSIDLLFPKNSGLTNWAARFAGDGFDARYIDNIWQVSSQFDLLYPTDIPEPAPVES